MKFARRQFVQATSGAAVLGALQLPTAIHAETARASEPDKVVVGIMGMQRGLALAKEFLRQANVEVRYVCDVDQRRLDRATATLQADFDSKSLPVGDFRKILDDDAVDALVCAAPNHWHGPATILACSAGKHVYVEKPASHNPAEGEWMVEAAAKHSKLVQVGMQRRSNSRWIDAVKRVHEGLLGDVFLAKSWYSNSRGSVGNDRDAEVPEYLDYDLWQGPAAARPYSPAVVHYNWHWRWNWGNGEIGNNGVHTLDLCRWGLQQQLPESTLSVGGRHAFSDAQETPDTNTASFQFPGGLRATWEGNSCHRMKSGFVTLFGTEGRLEMDENGANRHFDRKGVLVSEVDGSPHSLRDHIANFLDCIRGEKSADQLNANIAIGHRSALLCHLANIAYRTDRIVKTDPETGRILNEERAEEFWQREYRSGWKPAV